MQESRQELHRAHIPAVLLPRERDNLGGGGAEGEVSHKESSSKFLWVWGWRVVARKAEPPEQGFKTIGALQMGSGEKGAGSDGQVEDAACEGLEASS